MATQRKTRKKKISFALPEREGEMLALYAKEMGVSRPAAVRRMVKSALREHFQDRPKAQPENQLGLFDAVQIDIFNNTECVR